MNKRDEVVRERVDEADERIMLALREGPQSLSNLCGLSEINYHTGRQRLGKLIRY